MPRAAIRRSVPKAAVPAERRRLSTDEREQQILAGAVRFFAERGFEGQLRDLASEIGVTHALLYHYFPTKQALIERVYLEVFEGRWKPEWEAILDDPELSPEEKFVRFYCDYAATIHRYEFVRIFLYSGLADHAITDRFFALLRQRLFPRLVRETRRHHGQGSSRAKPSERELELLIGLHGGIFYTGMRRWVYHQAIHSEGQPAFDEVLVRDRVRAYLAYAGEVLAAKTSRRRGG